MTIPEKDTRVAAELSRRSRRSEKEKPYSPKRSKRIYRVWLPLIVVVIILGAGIGWLGLKAWSIKDQLEGASDLVARLKKEVIASDSTSAADTLAELRRHTANARADAEDPLWNLVSGVPVVGPNFAAISETARSADDVTNLGLAPLLEVYESLDWNALVPGDSAANLEPLRAAAPSIASSAYAVQASYERLEGIDTSNLLREVADPLRNTVGELKQASGALNSAADAATLIPAMLGADSSRHYLLVIQNNAEVRASGGIPGALAVLNFDKGKLSLGNQSSATDMGAMSPVIPVDQDQVQIYSTRLGKYMQDVNLTPDFPTAAMTAKAMWEEKYGQHVDGVISVDPVVLGYILQSTGPIRVTGPELAATKAAGLPTELTGDNVVPTLLSDVYAKIQEPKLQDAYFAGVAKEIFSALSNGKGEAKGLVSGITRGVEERRVLLWSGNSAEQSVLAKYTLSGSISGPSTSPAQFGVYFNDGTGAKMDYYVKRTVQLIRACPADGYGETTVRITSTNTAPSDASTSLPRYVTGGGHYGVPPGTVQTNLVAYGPAQATIELAKSNGTRTDFAPYQHAGRPVGIVAERLAPGETKTVEFMFGKIVQHGEPDLAVTPTLQAVKDVILPTENASCGQGQ